MQNTKTAHFPLGTLTYVTPWHCLYLLQSYLFVYTSFHTIETLLHVTTLYYCINRYIIRIKIIYLIIYLNCMWKVFSMLYLKNAVVVVTLLFLVQKKTHWSNNTMDLNFKILSSFYDGKKNNKNKPKNLWSMNILFIRLKL